MQALKQAGNKLTRENVLKQAASLTLSPSSAAAGRAGLAAYFFWNSTSFRSFSKFAFAAWMPIS